VQVELLARKRWRIRLEFANVISEYLETFHRSPTPLLNSGGR
jgi:hypothetical protein